MSYTENAIKMMSASVPAEQAVSDQPCTNTIIFELRKQFIRRVDTATVASGSKNYLKARFETQLNDWCKPITAIFDSYTVLLDDNNECFIPWEALSAPHTMAVSAFSADLHTAIVTPVVIEPSGYISGETPEPPTTDVYQQLIDIAKNAENVANSVREDANSGAFDGKPGQVGPEGPQGPAGQDSPQIDDTQASPDHPWSGAKVEQELNAVYEVLEKSNIQFPVAYSGTSIHADNTMAENLTLNRNSVEILGQTIQNCLDHSSADKFSTAGVTVEDGYIVLNAKGKFVNFFMKRSSGVVKPSTQYTFVVDISENTIVGEPDASLSFGDTATNETPFSYSARVVVADGKTGVYKVKLSSKNIISGDEKYFDRGFLSEKATSGTIKFRYSVIEGDWTNKDISWVPFGLNTPQTTEMKMCGKNLLSVENTPIQEISGVSINRGDDGSIILNGTSSKELSFSIPINLPLPSGEYTFSNTSVFSQKMYVSLDNKNPTMIGPTLNKKTFSVQYTTTYKVVFVWIGPGETFNNSVLHLQLERSTIQTPYEPYIENIVNINDPLGSVSDTIRDRVYLKDGKAYYEKNVELVSIDGSGSVAYNLSATLESVHRISYQLNTGFTTPQAILCDTLPMLVDYSDDYEHAYMDSYVWLFIEKTKILDTSSDGLQAYFAGHPVTIVRPLPEPIITEISIADFYSYAGQTNWYTTNTVKPTITAEIPSDISAVVGGAIAENAALRQENAALSQQVAALSEELQVSKILLGVD